MIKYCPYVINMLNHQHTVLMKLSDLATTDQPRFMEEFSVEKLT